MWWELRFCDHMYTAALLSVTSFSMALLSIPWRTLPGFYLLPDVNTALVGVMFAAGTGW